MYMFQLISGLINHTVTVAFNYCNSRLTKIEGCGLGLPKS